MSFVYLVPVMLSFLVLAAHFLRTMNLFLVGLCLACILLLALRRKWVPWVIEILLLLGAFEWLATLMIFINQRIEEGRDWKRMAIILGSVLLWTAASGLVFVTPRLRRRYSRPPT